MIIQLFFISDSSQTDSLHVDGKKDQTWILVNLNFNRWSGNGAS